MALYCSNCGKLLSNGDAYCPSCGKSQRYHEKVNNNKKWIIPLIFIIIAIFAVIFVVFISLLFGNKQNRNFSDLKAKVDNAAPGEDDTIAPSYESLSYLTYDQAAEIGGYYIKRNDRYYPLAVGDFLHSYSLNNCEGDTYIATTPNTIPTIGDGDELVLFSSDMISRAAIRHSYYSSYTVPVFVYDGNPLYEPILYYDSDVLSLYDDTLHDYYSGVEWKSIQDFFENVKSETVYLYSFNVPDADWDDLGEFTIGEYEDESVDDYSYCIGVGLKGITNVEVEYYIGSAYGFIEIPSCVGYWMLDEYMPAETQTTLDGFFLFDTSSWEPGTYVIYVGRDDPDNACWGFSLGESNFHVDSALFFEIE